MLACLAPRCSAEVYARGLCRGHYARAMRAEKRGEPPDLSPLRDPEAPALTVLSLRVTEEVRAKALGDPEGARRALTRWVRR